MEKKKCGCRCRNNSTKTEAKAADTYAGVAVDTSDGNKVSEKLVDERTATLNNNPRNDQ